MLGLVAILGIVGSGFEAPEVGTHGGFATGGVFLSVEGCEVGCLLGGVVESRVDGCRNSCKLGADSGFLSRYGRSAGYGSGEVVGALRWVASTIFWSAACGDFLSILFRAPETVSNIGA